MQRRIRRAGALVVGAVLAVAMSACGGDGDDAGTKSADGITTFTLGVPPVGDSLPVYQAIEKGYFQEKGLKIEPVPAASGATAINALISRSTDLALVSYPTLINAHASGLPVTIAATAISGTDTYKSGAYVKADSPIKQPADMIGKSMATPSLNSVGDIWFRGILKQQGLDHTKVKFVEIPQANMATALGSGDVDAAFMTEPTVSAASKKLNLRPLGYQNGPQGLFATSKKTLEEKPQAIKGFREALAKAVADIDKDPHGVAKEMLPKYAKMDVETAATMSLPDFITEWNGRGVQQLIDLMVDLGILKRGFDANELYKNV